MFQSCDLDFSKVKPMVDSTCESLTDLLECEGVFIEMLYSAIIEENVKLYTEIQSLTQLLLM